MSIKHAGYWKPKIFPLNGNVAPVEMDRMQEITGAPTLPVEKLYEIGRKDKVCSNKGIPEVAVTARQFEYGSLELFQALGNKPYSGDSITLDDLSDAFFDIVGYEGTDASTLVASILMPKSRLNGLGINIADRNAVIERTFDIRSDNKITFQNTNKYYIYKNYVVETGEIDSGNTTDIVISDPTLIIDPDTLSYLYRVIKVSGSTTTFLDEGIDFTYVNGTSTLTVNDVTLGDVIKVYYTATTYITGQQYHELNDVDSCALYAYNASIYLIDGMTSNYVHRLNSINIGVTFERLDLGEIGTKDTVETGIKTKTVTVTTTGNNESYSFDEILRGVYGTNYGKIDITKFKDTISLVIKVYADSDKNDFKIGYKIDNLAVSKLDTGIPVNDFLTKGFTLDSDNLLITTDEPSLGI